MKSAIQELGNYVEERTGIKPESVGEHSWQRAMRCRMEVIGVEQPCLYLEKVRMTHVEFMELLELITVPETWFFRDRSALDFLATFVKKREVQECTKPWNILSLACATGEEPYSIAMALCDAGVPLERFSIEGVDISKNALAIARRGIYGPHSFRSKLTLMHKGHFDQTEHGYAVHTQIKNRVKFVQANIKALPLPMMSRKYDAVFCRNALIYFGSQIQNQVFELCDQLVTEDGLLFFGPTESELARLRGFSAVGPRKACAFRHREQVSGE